MNLPLEKLKHLLDDTPVNFYWLGFFLADAHFAPCGSLDVCLSVKDIDHMEKLCAYLGSNLRFKKRKGENAFCRTAVRDHVSLGILKERYKITQRKTYNPPDLSALTELQKECLKIGYVDGDGCIAKRPVGIGNTLSITTHASWQFLLQKLFNKKGTINKDGYFTLEEGQNKELKRLKQIAIDNSLPIMKRKWDKIELDKNTFYEICAETRPKIMKLFEEGNSIVDIAHILDLPATRVVSTLECEKLYTGKRLGSKIFRRKLDIDNKTGYPGLSVDKGAKLKKWKAMVFCDNKQHYVGHFLTKEGALEAIKAFRKDKGLVV